MGLLTELTMDDPIGAMAVVEDWMERDVPEADQDWQSLLMHFSTAALQDSFLDQVQERWPDLFDED